tara:strand:+ start:313 stop:528 length:216 start_codon:yes stop_codon:yes gene_type:complete
MDSYRFHIRKSKKNESLITAYNYELDTRVEGENKQGLVKALRDKLGNGRCYIRRKKIIYSKKVISKKERIN